MKIRLREPKEKRSPLNSIDNFKKISQHLNHSQNKTLNLAKDLRSATCNRKILTPGLRQDKDKSSHRLDDVYSVVTKRLTSKVGIRIIMHLWIAL